MSIDRLRALQRENDRKGLDMDLERGRFAALAARHADGTAPRAVSSFNLFQTPEPIARRMAALFADRAKPGDRVLEPSAGLGRLFLPLYDLWGSSATYTLVDNSTECLAELFRVTDRRPGAKLKAGDFLEMTSADLGGLFDAVVMNPPFKQGRDIKHIKHAASMLAPGGLLVALCYDGVRQNDKLKPLSNTWERLPKGSFKAEGTGADVALLTIRKGKA